MSAEFFSPQRTYVQRYWVNKDFWKSPDGPVFLYIGGEGGIDESTVMGGETIYVKHNLHITI